jgi:Leucine-rich repeat (LRR) protein
MNSYQTSKLLSALTELDLNNNQITDLKPLSTLTNFRSNDSDLCNKI